MPFKDTKEGKTHSMNDGCGEPAHNVFKMQIIDMERRGNVVRFYLGENGKQHGDDWNDKPYEHNAGRVYKEFVKGYFDMAFAFDICLFEPSHCTVKESDSGVCKDDLVARKTPCLVVLAAKDGDMCWSFSGALENEKAGMIYYGDTVDYLMTIQPRGIVMPAA